MPSPSLTLNWSVRAIRTAAGSMMVELAPLPPRHRRRTAVITPPQPPAPVEELPMPKLAEAPKPKIACPSRSSPSQAAAAQAGGEKA
jgi:protein TonB